MQGRVAVNEYTGILRLRDIALLFPVCDQPRIRVCMPEEAIQVRGARVNNLKNISFSIPINQMTVVTGVSGSGKSSLAFDTIYAEGQRRYVESLSAYARQFLERMDKPDVDEIREEEIERSSC